MTAEQPNNLPVALPKGIAIQFVPSTSVDMIVPGWHDEPTEGFWIYEGEEWPSKIIKMCDELWRYDKSGGVKAVTKKNFPLRFWGPIPCPPKIQPEDSPPAQP